MRFQEVHSCDEFCPFYDKHVSYCGREQTVYERCELLGYDYDDPQQVLVRMWDKRRREVEDSYKHVRIADRPDREDMFPPVPDFCPLKQGPVIVKFQPNTWEPWREETALLDHYGDSPMGRTKKRVQEEQEEKRRQREQRRRGKELKEKEKEEKKAQRLEAMKAREAARQEKLEAKREAAKAKKAPKNEL
jgi:hypothetical protein